MCASREEFVKPTAMLRAGLDLKPNKTVRAMKRMKPILVLRAIEKLKPNFPVRAKRDVKPILSMRAIKTRVK